MVKMIDDLELRYRLNRLEKLYAKHDFLGRYQDLVKQRLEERLSRKKNDIIAVGELRLRKMAIAAGIDTKALKQEKEDGCEHIEKKYYWKARALKTLTARKISKRPEDRVMLEAIMAKKLKQLETEKDKRLQRFLERYVVTSGKESGINDYESLFSRVTETTKLQNTRLETAIRSRMETSEHRLSSRMEKTKQAITRHLARVDTIVGSRPKVEYNVPDDVILRLENLTMRFGGLVAVDNLTFDVREGEIFGLIGPNGAGKTTVFNCITKFYRPASGRMYFRKNAVEVIVLNDYPVHKIIRQGIVRTFQNVELIWELSVIDNLLVAAHSLFQTGFFGQLLHLPKLRLEEAVLRAKADKILKQMGLEAFRDVIPYGLPYGVLKKIELARTLMVEPRMIILDEPAAGLNDAETADLARIIRQIRDEMKITIFLVEHDMGLVMDVCDRIAAISFGKLLAVGTPKQIQANKVVRDAYLGEE